MKPLKNPVNERDHVRGARNPFLTLLEYGDYQCPFCAAAHVKIKVLEREFAQTLRYSFRHFPLIQIHEHAFLGAMTAEAAGEQDRFWEMHDLLFEAQVLLSPTMVIDFARALELDIPRFEHDLRSEKLESKIKQDYMTGVASGVRGTPTLYLDNLRYEGPLEPRTFQRLVA